jgi:hypothetical protein
MGNASPFSEPMSSIIRAATGSLWRNRVISTLYARRQENNLCSRIRVESSDVVVWLIKNVQNRVAFYLWYFCSCVIDSAVSNGFEERTFTLFIPVEERRIELVHDGSLETMPIGILCFGWFDSWVLVRLDGVFEEVCGASTDDLFIFFGSLARDVRPTQSTTATMLCH